LEEYERSWDWVLDLFLCVQLGFLFWLHNYVFYKPVCNFNKNQMNSLSLLGFLLFAFACRRSCLFPYYIVIGFITLCSASLLVFLKIK
jgi:hypothetical protein